MTIPALRGTTWRNNGRSAWNSSRFEHISAFKRRLLTLTGWNLKCHVIIVIKTDLSGFVVPMHSGLCEQYIKSLGLTPSGFDFLFCACPHTLGQQTPPEPVLIPYTSCWNANIRETKTFNLFVSGRCGCNFRSIIFRRILGIDILIFCCEIDLSWLPENPIVESSTLVQVMAWCHQAASHYLRQCWPDSMSPYGMTRPL